MPRDINDIADYILLSAAQSGAALIHHKLHRLLFYVQAWSLVEGTKAFDGKFQAWVYGPVSREIFDRFAKDHTLYDFIGAEMVRSTYDADHLDEDTKHHIDEVLEAYMGFEFVALSDMTRRELPWISARGSLAPDMRCEVELDEEVMRQYYGDLLAHQ
jgi:uncharacterized phage-associated protein